MMDATGRTVHARLIRWPNANGLRIDVEVKDDTARAIEHAYRFRSIVTLDDRIFSKEVRLQLFLLEGMPQ